MAQNKNNTTAEKLRNEGNTFFKQGKYFDALIKYNESLCHSKIGSVNIALAYANRSAVFMALKMYEKCLKNIQRAIDAGYPQEKIPSLNNRKERATKGLDESPPATKQSDPFEFIKLSYPAHPKNPEIAECLELAENEKYGRHIIANRDLKAGDVIAIEKHSLKVEHSFPSSASESANVYYQFCAHCFLTNKMDLIPCNGCTSTMYCDDDCKRKAYDESHRYECKIMNFLHEYGNITHATVRAFFKALHLCNDSIDELEEFAAGHLYGRQKSTVFDFDFTNMSDKEANKANLLILLSGAHHETPEIIRFCFTLANKLESFGSLRFSKEFQRTLFRLLLVKIYGVFSINAYILEQSDSNPEAKKLFVDVGSGYSSFFSLLSHSCDPNVIDASSDNKHLVIVIQPIKKGEQLCFCYGFQFANKTKEERQTKLLEEYHFICTCKACVNDYPLRNELENDFSLSLFLEKKRKKVLQEMKNAHMTPEAVWKKFGEYCEKVNESRLAYGNEAPSKQMFDLVYFLPSLLDMIFDSTIEFPQAGNK